MLISLSIHNYAIIQQLELTFQPGLNIITGETGAGKSILLGALGLISGSRADHSVISDSSSKCIVEAVFDTSSLNIHNFFQLYDLDYDTQTIVRREILPGGKSRAFVNDVPVQLNVLKALSDELIDIHSQHQNLLLRNNTFQLQLLDAFASTSSLLKDLKTDYNTYKSNLKKLEELKSENLRFQNEQDFIQFQFNELAEVKLVPEEEILIETELKKLTHSDEIKKNIENSMQALEDSDISIISQLAQIKHSIAKIAPYHPELEKAHLQLQSIQIEIKELAYLLNRIGNEIDSDPIRLQELEERNNELQRLFHKHKVNSVTDLIAIQKEYEAKLASMNSMDDHIHQLQLEIDTQEKEIKKCCEKISQLRQKAVPNIIKKVSETIDLLGIPNAVMEIQIQPKETFNETGMDEVSFLFSANKGMPAADLGKAGSGGEISRLMLAFKALLSELHHLPCILFDEIDTGVSGGMADKIGQLMKSMSLHRQLIVITHLPQIASKSTVHFKVSKTEKNGIVNSQIDKLQSEEQVKEIARLLSGERITDAALNQAQELLKEALNS